MSTDESEIKLSTLNPLFLQAVRDEASKGRKAEPVNSNPVSPVADFAMDDIPLDDYSAETDLEPPESFEPFQLDEPEVGKLGGSLPVGSIEVVKAAVAGKQAEISQIELQLGRLNKIKERVEPPPQAGGKTDLNELKMKRLAIQMAIMSDSETYGESDLLEIDRQIADCRGLNAGTRRQPAPNSLELVKLSAKLAELEDKRQILQQECNELIQGHNLRIAINKAEAYLDVLTTANILRHELLALAELLADDGCLLAMKLGGELPNPSGLKPFDEIALDALTTTIDGIEEAKLRLQQEVLN